MEGYKYEMKLLEKVVKKAWDDEKLVCKLLLKEDVERTAKLCQGITNNVQRRITGIFECAKFYFEYKKQLS